MLKNNRSLPLTALFQLKKLVRAVGQRSGDDDAEGVFGDEGRDATHARAERGQGRCSLLVSEFVRAEGFGGASKRTSQTVERQIALRKHFAARLKISEREEHYARSVCLAG
jgi:hypothetical protein